jgi:hypothetical protein
MVVSEIRNWVIIQIVKAAILWLISLLNPASALVRAIMAIYNVVMFFIERMNQIRQLVQAIVESVTNIVAGNIGAAANRIEQAMGRSVPVILGFLASLLGLTGITQKIQSIIRKVQRPVDLAIDKVIAKVIGGLKKLKEFGRPKDPNERLRLGMQAALRVVNRFAGKRVGTAVLNPLLSAIKTRYGFRTLHVIPADRKWSIEGIVNPRLIRPTQAFQDLVSASEQRKVEGPMVDLERILVGQPFNFNVRSPQGRQSVDKIIAYIRAAGDIGFNFAGILRSGRLNAAKGFPDLVKQLQNYNMLITAYPVLLEALRLIDGGLKADRLRFEDSGSDRPYDVDLGVLNRRGEKALRSDDPQGILNRRTAYSLAIQVKLTTQHGAISNTKEAMNSLRRIPASRKVAVIYVSGISYDNYSITLDYRIRNLVANSSGIEVEIIMVDDQGKRLRYL